MAVRHDALALAWYAAEVRRDALWCGQCSPRATAIAQVRRSLPRRDARLPLQAEPRAFERRYRAQLRRRMREVHALMTEALQAPLAKLAAGIERRERATKGDGARRLDTAASDLRDVLRVVARIERAVAASPLDPESIATMGAQVAGFTERSVAKQIATVIGIDVTSAPGITGDLLSSWAADNVKLITSLESKYFDEIAEAIDLGVREGVSTRSISDAMRDRFNVSKSRADLIAVDQVGTLNAKITETRQTTLGIEEYKWSSSGDQRVRPLHVELDGTIRRWDDPHPTEGHPGEPIRCRCSAIPIIVRADSNRLRVLLLAA